MTATSPPSASDETPDEEPEFADLCEQARDLAASGHFGRAAQVYEQVLKGGARTHRPRAAMGLAVARHGEGRIEDSREAARIAIETGHPEYAPRAASHMALSYEEAGQAEESEHAWRKALHAGNPRYAPAAHHGLARISDARGDLDDARRHWEGALGGDATVAPGAAEDYAERLLARGQTDLAEDAIHRGLAIADQPGLRMLLGAVHVERAIAEFGTAVDGAAPDTAADSEGLPPAVAGTAYELLARLLTLRGDTEGASDAWEQGLLHPDAEVAQEVHARLRRGFLEPDPDLAGADVQQWWDPFLEAAVAEGSAPMLAGELFAALGAVHARVALPVVEGETQVAALRSALEDAVRTPSGYVWGRALHDDFRERLRLSAGSEEDVLPEGWPDHQG